MISEVKVPTLAESISEAALVSWHKNPGEFVRKDEVLIELETDKVVLEITAPEDGVLKEIKKNGGETVESDEVIATIDTEAKASQQVRKTEVEQPKEKPTPPAEKPEQPTVAEEAGPKLSPAVRKLLDEYGLDAETVPASGKGGRITKADVLDYVAQAGQPQPIPEEPEPSLAGERPEQRVSMSRLRARIAERLKDAQDTAAILTTFNEVNMKPVMDLRARYKDQFEKEYGIKLGFMSFFIKASVEALKKYPIVNASVDGENIIYLGYFDIGVAVSTARGLVVPIIRNADTLSFAELESQLIDYGRKARDGKLTMEELSGGTFTISNGGIFGSLLSTPILNPPQSGILGMHKIQERPMAENGEVVIRPMMYLALSYDHRIIDGRDAVLFLVTIKELLEDPSRMLLQI